MNFAGGFTITETDKTFVFAKTAPNGTTRSVTLQKDAASLRAVADALDLLADQMHL